MSDLYEIELEKLIKLLEKSKESFNKYSDDILSSMNRMFNIGGREYQKYKMFVETNESRAKNAIKNIAFSKLKEKKLLKCTEYNNEAGIIENGKSALIFVNYNELGEYYDKYMKKQFSVEKLILVVICNPDINAEKYLFDEINKFNKNDNISIERVSIKKYWIEQFGAEEYEKLLCFINAFNEKAQEICGFYTTITPTDEVIDKFRKSIGSEINNYDYRNKLLGELYQQQIQIMYHNYIERGLWKLMIGEKSYAISFLTSEWYYKMYKITENLDLTNIVCGYLKSIEQLLFEVINIYKGKGIKLKSTKNNRPVLYTQDSEDVVDTTLGSLENAIKYSDIFDINKFAQNWIVNFIDEWRKKQRNGYFHKDSLHDIKKVNEIRENAIILYFLILGSCSISDDDLEKLK